jgi:hypothetical protein
MSFPLRERISKEVFKEKKNTNSPLIAVDLKVKMAAMLRHET